MVPNVELHILTIHFEPLYKGQHAWSQGVLYIAVTLYHLNVVSIGQNKFRPSLSSGYHYQ